MEAIIMHEHSLNIREYNENNKYENKKTYYEFDSIKLSYEKKYKFKCNECQIYNNNIFYGINTNYESKDYKILYPDFKEDLETIILGNDKEKLKYFYNLYVNFSKDNKNLKNENEKLKKEIEYLKNNKKSNNVIQNLKKENENLKKENEKLKLNIEKYKKLNDENKILNDKKENLNIQYEISLKFLKKNQNLRNEKVFNEKIAYDKNNKKNINKNLIEKENEKENNLGNFLNDNYNGFYDIIIDIKSIANLNKEGWEINYSNREFYNSKKDCPTITIGVIGNGNKGKSFFLQKLSEYNIPKGFNVKTKGLSIRYAEKEDHNLTILDSAGQETPLLNNNNEIDNEYLLRDKLNTELFIQKFIILKSKILFIVVGNITLSEQKLITRIKKEGKNKQIFIIHNLQIFQTKEQVEDYIENTLKKMYKIQERIFQNFTGTDKKNTYNKFFVEEDDENENKNIVHLILINDYCENNEYYNLSTFNFIKRELEVVKERQIFPVIEECKNFIINFSRKNFEKNIINENSIELKYIDENTDKLYINNFNNIKLKKLVIDEIGNIHIDNGYNPEYSYYILDDLFYINIELPRGGNVDIKIKEIQNYQLFIINGKLKEDNNINNNRNKIEYKYSTRKNFNFNLLIKIPNNLIFIYDYVTSEFKSGILTYKYKIKKIESYERTDYY